MLVIQLARLGDLLQSLPAITALKEGLPTSTVDLLCPSQLASIGRMFPGIDTVLEWDGPGWHGRAAATTPGLQPEHIQEAERHISDLVPELYDRVYVLNQHPRALLAGALLAKSMVGPRVHGPLDEQLTPWASYVRKVATSRQGHRVHLADAFCGLCRVCPPGLPLTLNHSPTPLPADLEHIGKHGGPWIGLLVGAGDPERVVPIQAWQEWITQYLTTVPRGRVVLIGQERERGAQIQDSLPPSFLGRIWDATSRTSLAELATILARCHRAIGADTGPLHLAAALGVKVIGWYFARARVHETGPYGEQHLVWQAVGDDSHPGLSGDMIRPKRWPIKESIAAVADVPVERVPGWSVWTSHLDRWGAYYCEYGQQSGPPNEREELWRTLQPVLN